MFIFHFANDYYSYLLIYLLIYFLKNVNANYKRFLTNTFVSFFRVYDYNNNLKLKQFNLEKGSWNRTTSRITSLNFVNAHDDTLLMVGSEDGSVRLWSNYSCNIPNREPTLVTAWLALSEITNANKNSYTSGNYLINSHRI